MKKKFMALGCVLLAMAAAVPAGISTNIVMEKAPKSIDAEAYRSLRSNIEYSSFDDEYRAIVVTSSVPGEGKST